MSRAISSGIFCSSSSRSSTDVTSRPSANSVVNASMAPVRDVGFRCCGRLAHFRPQDICQYNRLFTWT